jgi:hypothetical protein
MKYIKAYEKRFYYYEVNDLPDDLPPFLPFKFGDYVHFIGDKNENIYKLVMYDSTLQKWFLDDAYLTEKPLVIRWQLADKLELVPDYIVKANKFNL